MSLFAHKLRALTEDVRKKKDDNTHMRERDVAVFVSRIKKLAQKAAKAGESEAQYAFDEIRKEICCERVPAIEEALKIEGFVVKFSGELKCGRSCCYRNRNQRCGFHYNYHVGYIVYW